MTQTKKNRWIDEEKWATFVAPLNNWLEDFEPTNEDEEDFKDITLMNLKRARRPENRPKIVKQLKIDFAEMDFEGWTVERLDKNIVKAMVRKAKANRKVHIAFFTNSNTVQTFTIEGTKYMHIEENTYADAQMKSDITRFKSLHKEGLDWQNPVFPVFIDAGDEEE